MQLALFEKVCGRCKIAQPLSSFSKTRKRPDGLKFSCKTCDKEVAAHYYGENKSRILKRNQEWFDKNHEKRQEWFKAYEAANKNRKDRRMARHRSENINLYLERGRQYRLQNPEKWREKNSAWRKANPHKSRAKDARYRAAKLQATPAWANKQRIEEFYFAADFLSMVTGMWYHVDHIVPLQSKLVRGLHWEGNLQVIPWIENIVKNNRYWPDMPI